MKPRLLNTYEEVTFEALRAVCDRVCAKVFPKVRVADVFTLSNSGISERHFSFALKSHFDFLVTDSDYQPLFSVEYDGPLHKIDSAQRARDQLKNELCDHFRQPLLRVNSRYLDREYRNLNLLTYFVEAWFLEEAFTEAQEQGIVPWDEGFDMTFICHDGSRDGKKWPYWISLDIQNAIQKLYESGRVANFAASKYVGTDEAGNYRCLSWLVLDHERVVRVVTGMRAQRFPAVVESDLIGMLAMFDLHEQVMSTLDGSRNLAISSDKFFKQELPSFAKKYHICCVTSCGGVPKQAA